MYEKITFAELSCYWRGLETCPVQTELCCVIIKSQACCWELLVVLKADFSFSIQPVVLVYLQLVNMTEACQS